MASRSARSRTIDTEEATEAQLLPRIGSETEWDPDLEAAFEQLKEDFRQAQSDGTVWVYRLPLDERGELISNAKHVYLFSAPVQRYSSEEIFAKVQAEYMVGLTVTCIRVAATKKGERGVRFNQIVMIEAPHRKEPDPAQSSNGLGDIVRAIQESNQATIAMMRDLVKPAPMLPGPPAAQPIAQIRELAEVVFLLSGGKQNAPVAPAQPAPSVLDQLKTLRELRGFVGELAGGTDASDDGIQGSGGPADVLKHLSPWAGLFTQLVARQNQQQAAQTPPARRRAPQTIDAQTQPTPAPTQAPPPPLNPFDIPTPPPQPIPTENAVIDEFRRQFKALTDAASEGAHAPDLVPLIMQMIPEDSPAEHQLLALLEAPNWWVQICAIYPPAAQFQDWYIALRNALMAAYEDDGAPATIG